ncbi:MAG: sugar ABC transporter permease [Schaalia hyovaginalis]|uniref:carbohydrate ABC transporter permease n=1 Tax=Actinomycetaceae TaxID=2049 RepID=UPI000E1FE8A8|nr:MULTISPECIES: sugar ABC transporter permease [Actinomycetaceae]MCF2711795.1 sugar ABC transporter permease [Schaalia hyovaginalis]MCI6411471.1 sugar ABC transporter permease [Schaalia hyovaginalis]MCI6557155.1 sugar ABC transporter permease [Schaalia hyovaginalis]MCI7512871.1 sugar ABC transporter permease [Schaalia hyovaginalis]MDD7555017.1 sugar ABC transporter permease [Schaalia hyovaginalis]
MKARHDAFRRDEAVTAAGLLTPATIILAIFTLYPILSAGYLSLTSWNGLTPSKEFIGLGNYTRLAADPEFQNSLLVTIVYAFGVCILSIISGLTVAALLDAPIRGRAIYRTIFFLPVVTSSAAAAIVWKYMFDDAGLVNKLLDAVGVGGVDWLQNRWLALLLLTILTVWKNIGFNAILYLTAMQALPVSVYEAAQLDGASAWQSFTRITVPLLRPMTFFVSIQSLITAFQSFDLAYVFTEGGPRGGTDVLGMLMYRQAFRLDGFGYGAAISFVSLALVLAVTAIQWRVTSKEER